jgi:transcriptional regulator with XRE-family HTH domain
VSDLFPDFYDRALELLVQARKASGFTQIEVAAALRRPQSFVSKYEKKERILNVAEYITIARILRVDPYKLLRTAEISAKK